MGGIFGVFIRVLFVLQDPRDGEDAVRALDGFSGWVSGHQRQTCSVCVSASIAASAAARHQVYGSAAPAKQHVRYLC